MLNKARFLIAASFALALSAAPGAAEEYSPLAPPEPPVIEFVPEVAEIPPAPLGLSKGGEEYSLQSNRAWKGAKQVKPFAKGDPNQYDAYPRQDWSYIWAPTCLPTAQKVVFERVYYLPGPPKNFAAEIQGTKYGIKLIKVFINGQLAIQSTSYPVYILKTEKRYPHMFRNGDNKIRIEVTKLADNAAYKFCQNGPLGISFRFYGEFSADLTTAAGYSGYHECALDVEGLDLKDITYGNLARHNHGPSAVYKANDYIRVTRSGSKLFAIKLTPQGNSVAGCTVTDSGNTSVMSCDIMKWAPDKPRTYPVKIELNMDQSDNDSNSTLSVYSATNSPTADPKGANNFYSDTLLLCYAGSPNPKCGTLPACY